MSKLCRKCDKSTANRHIGRVCTDCTGIFPSGEKSAETILSERYNSYVNTELTNGNLPLNYPDWLATPNKESKG